MHLSRPLLAAGLLATPLHADPQIRTAPFPEGMIPAGRGAQYEAPPMRARPVEVGGESRTYYVYDGSADGEVAQAGLLLLHGSGRDGRSMIDMWRETAEAEGLVLVAPDSAGQAWSSGEDPPGVLVSALLDAHDVAEFDMTRIYLFGHSAGGIMAQYYANRLEEPWRAVAVHAATLPPDAVRDPGTGLPVLHVLGEEDRTTSPQAAQDSAVALDAAGHDTTLLLIEDHNHWYYEIGPLVSDLAWDFFKRAP